MIAAGQLRTPITIQQRIDVPDDMGQPIPTWLTVLNTRAQVEVASGREAIAAGQVQATSAVRVTTRWQDGVTPAMRVLIGTRTLNIGAVINVDERNREMRLLCTEA